MREKMPDRRHSWTQKVKLENQTIHICFGEYADGRLGEVWVDIHKQGTFSRGVVDAMARMASLALQCGAGVADVASTLRQMNFPPHGKVSGEGVHCDEATSIADLIATELLANYPPASPPDKSAGYVSDPERSGA